MFKGKIILQAFLLSLIGIFLLPITSAFASTPSESIDELSIDKRNEDYSIKFVKLENEWPNIRWPWSKKEKTKSEILKEKKLERMQNILSRLVEEGTINQEKSDEVLKKYQEFIESKELQRQDKKSRTKEIKKDGSFWNQLITEGIITKEEAESIKESCKDFYEKCKKHKKSLEKKGNQ